jgi:hypothetical protein
MEADWSVEIGPGLSCIDASWDGFIDLRRSPDSIDSLPETQLHPALREALLALNEESSRVFTTKCDIWLLTKDEIDPDEFEANIENAQTGFASYIDILERDAGHFMSFAFHEQLARSLTDRLRRIALRQCRIELVLRAAVINEQLGYGLTLYAAGCGFDEPAADAAWQAALTIAVAATIAGAHPQHTGE